MDQVRGFLTCRSPEDNYKGNEDTDGIQKFQSGLFSLLSLLLSMSSLFFSLRVELRIVIIISEASL